MSDVEMSLDRALRVQDWHDRLLQAVSLPTTINWAAYNRVIAEMAEYAAWRLGKTQQAVLEKRIKKRVCGERVVEF